MYRKVDSSLDFVQREEAILKFWQEKDIFRKQVKLRENGEKFTFYDGPPTANGKPHIGHILTRAIKDLIPRYQSMKGKNVLRKAGWDTHGLPVELEVEKLLGINGKDQIEKYGIEPFIKQCRESVWKYKKEWEEMSDRVAYWADMEHPYITYENNYIESEWWALKKIHERGLLYQGHKIVPYCPRCGTALASHEVAQGYKDVTENSIYVRFAVKDEADTYFAAWTTTPWTLPSNVALTVGPEIDYVLCEREEEGRKVRYYLAEAHVEDVLGEGATILRRMKGGELTGKRYEPILPYARDFVAKSGKDAWVVVAGDFVTTGDGTGIVHIAPAFGEDDANVGHRYDLPFVQLVQEDGCLPPEVTDFAGRFCKEADPLIIDKLKAEGSLLKVLPYTHSYPFCWRCDTPLIYYARTGWFIRTTDLRAEMVEHNQKINWIPPTIGSGRFGNFLENNIDWNISRERYWGMPLPIWHCDDCGHIHVVGSIEELKSMSDDCPEEIELHRPYIDAVHLRCPHCGKPMHRVPEVIDCWFDSGAMPFAQWHYPFENKEIFEARFPADFISEAVDQTRGWFNSLHMMSNLLFDDIAFKNCIVLGLVQDKDGLKMSKHKGNVVDPWSVLNTEGADAVRWYFYSNSQPWLPSRFSLTAVNEDKRKFMGTLWNTYAFFILYANIDHFEACDHHLDPATLGVMDRWILSRLNSLVAEIDEKLSAYDITASARALEDFVDELSNWYVRRGRERFWAPGMEKDKIDAYLTLYTVLLTLAKVAAPFTPFLAEELYQNLAVGHLPNAKESVHLEDFPRADESLIDKELEKQMALVLELVALGRTARAAFGLKTRQPLKRMLCAGREKLAEEYAALVSDELNVKGLEWTDDASALQDYHFKPQLRLLGKRFGKRLAEVKSKLDALDGVKAWRSLKENGFITLDSEEGPEKISEEELLVEVVQAKDYASASDHGVTVALDTRLSQELIDEGLLREVVSKVQTMRRDSGFEVTDHITLAAGGNEKIYELLKREEQTVLSEVLGDALISLEDAPEELKAAARKWDINGEELFLAVSREKK